MEPSEPSSGKPLRLLSDEELFRSFQVSHKKEMMGELFNRYLHLVLGVCFKYLKDEEKSRDAAMQVFEQLLTKPAKQDIRSFKDWLFIITKNHCLMVIRHEQAGQRVLTEKFFDLQSEIMESSSQMHLYDAEEQERRFEKLRLALARLPDEQKQCVELFYYEDKSYQDISRMTGYDLNKVKSCLQNGKRNLKIMLDHGNE
ncbi:MAG: RNA polymerase sigma factor [Bacteroidales bacterium]